eukprot:911417-Pyramimonas_sp.AAC.1
MADAPPQLSPVRALIATHNAASYHYIAPAKGSYSVMSQLEERWRKKRTKQQPHEEKLAPLRGSQGGHDAPHT